VTGAAANALPGAVPDEVKEERWHRFMAAQQVISAKRLKKKVGRTIDVLIDETGPKGAIGRSKADAPEIDGLVKVSAAKPPKVGEIVKVKITGADEYDLSGKLVA
jgi:ribosomal protein S12 methylthiotransferase